MLEAHEITTFDMCAECFALSNVVDISYPFEFVNRGAPLTSNGARRPMQWGTLVARGSTLFERERCAASSAECPRCAHCDVSGAGGIGVDARADSRAIFNT